jgi:hypothetical protein
MSRPNYDTSKEPNAKPPIENAPAPARAFGGGTRDAATIESREIFRTNVKLVPEKPAPTKDDFGGYGRKS